MLLPDGRGFEADRDVTIRIAPAALRPPVPNGPVDIAPVPDVPVPEVPHKLEPAPVMAPATAGRQPTAPEDHLTAWRYRPEPRPGARLLPPVPVR